MAFFWVVAPCGLVEVYTDGSEVLALAIIALMMEAASISETSSYSPP
jgi:hypothetical protein